MAVYLSFDGILPSTRCGTHSNHYIRISRWHVFLANSRAGGKSSLDPHDSKLQL